MKTRVVVVLVLAAAIGAAFAFRDRLTDRFGSPPPAELVASGTVEATEAQLGFAMGEELFAHRRDVAHVHDALGVALRQVHWRGAERRERESQSAARFCRRSRPYSACPTEWRQQSRRSARNVAAPGIGAVQRLTLMTRGFRVADRTRSARVAPATSDARVAVPETSDRKEPP